MEIIKNRALKSPGKSKKNLQASLPEEINIYNQSWIEKKEVISTSHLNLPYFESQFKNNYTVVFGLSGEVEGFAICMANPSIDKALFSESMNILIGNYLSALDQNENLFATLLSPIIFNLQENQSTELQEQFYKFNQRLRMYMHEAETFHAQYLMHSNHQIFPVTVTFVIKNKGQEYAWNNA
jgi:hypothetical protein